MREDSTICQSTSIVRFNVAVSLIEKLIYVYANLKIY